MRRRAFAHEQTHQAGGQPRRQLVPLHPDRPDCFQPRVVCRGVVHWLQARRRHPAGSPIGNPTKPGASHAGNLFRFTLTGLIVFSLALFAGASFIGYKLAAGTRQDLKADTFAVNPNDKSRSVHVGPWGELITRNIGLERPAEFLTEEVATPQPETWTFAGQPPNAVKALLAKDGLSAAQVAAAFAPGKFREDKTGTVLVPSADFLLSLGAEVRQQLYLALAGQGVNMYLDFPYIFPGDSLDAIYANPELHPEDVTLLKQFIYANGAARQLSD